MTFPTGRITGLQSADLIETIEIQDGGGKIETRVRESCCTVARLLELRVRRGKTQVRTLHARHATACVRRQRSCSVHPPSPVDHVRLT